MLPSVQRAHPRCVNVRIASCEHIGNSHRCRTRSAISHDVSCCGDLFRRAEYEAARRLWNATIDKHPGLIVRCTGVPDWGVPAEFVRAAFGANYARIARVKAQYDPTNFVRVNQNITPAASA